MTSPVIPNTTLASSHGLVMQLDDGAVIGGVNSFTPNLTRQVTEVYEFGNVSGLYADGRAPGMPFDNPIGNASGLTIEIRRWDMFNRYFEAAFGNTDLAVLANQTQPLASLRAILNAPDARNSRVRTYHNCWFTNKSRTFEANGDRTINVGGSISYLHVTEQPLPG